MTHKPINSVSYLPGQCELPETAPDLAAIAKKRSSEPMRGSKPQAPCDVGLFGDEAKQAELF